LERHFLLADAEEAADTHHDRLHGALLIHDKVAHAANILGVVAGAVIDPLADEFGGKMPFCMLDHRRRRFGRRGTRRWGRWSGLRIRASSHKCSYGGGRQQIADHVKLSLCSVPVLAASSIRTVQGMNGARSFTFAQRNAREVVPGAFTCAPAGTMSAPPAHAVEIASIRLILAFLT